MPAGQVEIDTSGIELEQLRDWLSAMILIREFEEACERLALAGKIPGGIHSAAGQEAVAVGAAKALRPNDVVTSSHRSHHHNLAKGLPPNETMAELFGRESGILGGKAGHMHLARFSLGLFGSNGIVGASLGIAGGVALAAMLRNWDQVAVGFIGDGGLNTGRVWEMLNLAAVWRLPLIAICENNLYAVETHSDRVTAGDDGPARATSFGVHSVRVDGQDVAAMFRAVRDSRERAVSGHGPTFIEAMTYRFRGHNTGDKETYRNPSEVQAWKDRDPINRLRVALEVANAVDADQFAQLEADARIVVAESIAFAEASAWPDPVSHRPGAAKSL
jgi:TPP-dependent pyruvate/acetoin dehydrogenase alpha subunit